jgi:hypothetical protein
LFFYSEQFDNGVWNKQGSAISANQAISPDGTTNADLLYPTANGSVAAAYQSKTISANTDYTQSVYVKAAGKNFAALYSLNGGNGTIMWVNLTTGAITNGVSASNRFATSVGNGWWRIGFTEQIATTIGYLHVYPTDAAGSAAVTANGTDGIYIYGAQIEAGAYATSYIPTTTAAVTRLDESTIKTGISSLIGQQEGVIYWEGLIPQEGTGGPSNSSNMLNSARNINSNSGFSLQHIKINNSVNALFFVGDGTFNPKISLTAGSLPSGTYAKIAFAYKSGSSALYVNGVLAASSSTTFTSSTTISEININDLYVYFGYPASQSLGQMLIFKTRLTNAQLAELTTL